MKKVIIQYSAILMLLLAAMLLSACGQVPMADRVIEQHDNKQESTTQTETDSIGNMKTIGEALGCVFAPQTCKK